MTITDEKLADLERRAKAATQPGPWTVRTDRGRHHADDGGSTVLDADGMWVAEVGRAAPDAAHIAACSPDVVLALVAEVRRLREVERSIIDWRTSAVEHARLAAVITSESPDADWQRLESIATRVNVTYAALKAVADAHLLRAALSPPAVTGEGES